MARVKIPVHVGPSRTAPVDRHRERPARERADGSSQACVPCPPQTTSLQEQSAPGGLCQGHEDLLEDVLSIADDLERALAAAEEGTPIREGVAITHRGVMRILRKHGLERVAAEQQRFDPRWHEAIGVVPAAQRGVDPGTVVQVLTSGYRRGAQLFRPARVVVAQ